MHYALRLLAERMVLNFARNAIEGLEPYFHQSVTVVLNKHQRLWYRDSFVYFIFLFTHLVIRFDVIIL